MRDEWTLSVSQLNEYVRKSLAGDPMLQGIRVSGELSGVKRHFSGHIYFTLKDEAARVQCVMFRSAAMGLSFQPEDGMRVVVRGSASLYAATGSFQIYADAIERQGVGELYLRFEALKRRLSEEGLFDPSLKRELPALPRTIGVVTSRTGAVLRDIVRVARRRDPNVRILLAPASVQGAGAAEEIARAIALLNRQGEADVILCGRGGGSLEDLWPFNEEIVARAIRASRIPVVSCVGHETDFTIADFAADLRAPTPSAAAELAVPDTEALRAQIDGLTARGARSLSGRLALMRARLNRLTASPALAMPQRALIEARRNALDAQAERLSRAALRLTAEKRRTLERTTDRLQAMPARLVSGRRERQTALMARLVRAGSQLTLRPGARLQMLSRALEAVNPDAVLNRGYAVIRRGGEAIASAAALKANDLIDIRLRDGGARARVLDADKETE